MPDNQRLPKLLIIDDEINMRHMLSSMLKSEYVADLAESGNEALEILKKAGLSGDVYDFILCDIKMPEMDGMAFLEEAHAFIENIPVIIMSAYGTMDIAIEAMKKGAYDYISKPFRKDELQLVLRKAMERECLKKENQSLRRQIEVYRSEQKGFGGMIGQSRAMQAVFYLAGKAADSDVPVLVTGESGTGKELVAKGIHSSGKRAGKAVVSVNCGALPENLIESELFGHIKGSFTGAATNKKGLFMEADGGTIFLDEIGELPLNLQVKLLRVLQENEIRPLGAVRPYKIDVRVIAATSRNLQAEMASGNFREDLYYRLNVLNIKIPPLRERTEDIPYLCLYFIEKSSARLSFSRVKGINHDLTPHLLKYSWPGNVRELENLVERAILLSEGDKLGICDFPEITEYKNFSDLRNHVSLFNCEKELYSIKEAQRRLESHLIRKALEKTGNNRTHAARLLEISHPSLLVKIRLYNLD